MFKTLLATIQPIVQLTKNSNFKVIDMINPEAFALVQDENTSAETLDELSNDENPFIRVRVAAHMNTSAETLVKLSNDETPLVKQFVAEHLNTPVDILIELSKDSDMSYWVAGNPNTPVELLNKFSKNEYFLIIEGLRAN